MMISNRKNYYRQIVGSFICKLDTKTLRGNGIRRFIVLECGHTTNQNASMIVSTGTQISTRCRDCIKQTKE